MRADRLLSILMLLQTREKWTTQALAHELQVSRRTILRDIDALSFSGVPIYTAGGHGGGVMLDQHYRTTLTGLKENEIQALFITNNTQLFSEIGLGEAIKNSHRKLTAALPLQHQPLVEKIRQRIYIDQVWWWHDSQPTPFWEELQHAVFDDLIIQVRYASSNAEPVERTLEPYSLVAKANTWYLIARREQNFRMYRVSRIQHLTILNEHFTREPGFDLVNYWHTHIVEFTESLTEYKFSIRIPAEKLGIIQWLMPERWNITGTPDERNWLTVNLQAESADLARMLVFGLSPDVIILDPSELRESITSTAREILAGMKK
jgi:predicted DNA-binding transcriptional regulator YafY